ncbi:MAG TPA: hypothetical protein VFT61_00280 [Sphingomicrobium sp.]|nr:hypothetical protein [Sphingomicrobium sp.]
MDNLESWEQARVEEFFAASQKFRAATVPYLGLAALKLGDSYTVISARLIFASATAHIVEREICSKSLRVILKRLESVQRAEEVIREAVSGEFEIAGERYKFGPRESADATLLIDPFDETMGAQMQLCSLKIRGCATRGLLDTQRLDWELRASNPPYLTFAELLGEIGLPLPTTYTVFEAYHTAPVAIDREQSSLCGTVLNLGVRVESGLPVEEASLGLVAIKPGEATVRETFKSSELTWKRDGEISVGTLSWTAPAGRAVQAVAKFSGVAFHYWWVVDPGHILNPRKTIFSTIDTDLSILRDFLRSSGSRGREFESAVSWLLWMLGFGVAHLGSETKTQDAVDVIAATPAGHFALIECTTGVIAADNKKLANLVSRRAVLVEKLKQANHNNVHVLPIIVTSKSREEVVHEIEPARERGVLVLTGEDLIALLERTDVLTNPDEIYAEAENQISTTKSEPNLPGIS